MRTCDVFILILTCVYWFLIWKMVELFEYMDLNMCYRTPISLRAFAFYELSFKTQGI